MGQFRKKPQKGGQMEVNVEAEQVAKIRKLRNFYNGPLFFSLRLQIPSNFCRELRVRLGFFVVGLTR